MNRTFKNVAFFFFIGFGAVYLTTDFLLNQARTESQTLQVIYDTFDMPFFFSAGLYALAALHEFIHKRYEISGINLLFWIAAVAWTMFLLYLNVGYQTIF